MSFGPRKPLKHILIALAVCVALGALLAGAFGFVVTRVPAYRVQVQDWLNEQTGLAVEFQSLSAGLRLYGPELRFDQAVLRTPDRTRILATATRGSVGFDLWRALREGRLMAGRFRLQSPQIGLIRTRDGRIQLLGQNALPERTEARPFAIEQLPTGVFVVRDAVVTFRDEITGRGPWSLSGVNFILTRSTGSMDLKGDASLPRSLGRALTFSAHAEGALQEYATLVSTFSVAGEALDLAGWADLAPDEWPAPKAGAGSLRATGTMLGPTLMRLSAQVDLHGVAAATPAWTIPLPVADPMQQPVAPQAGPGAQQSVQTPSDDHRQEPILAASGDAPPAASSSAAPPRMASYERFALKLDAQRSDGEWRVALTDIDISSTETPWRAQRIEARWMREAGEAFSAHLHADRIVLGALWPLLAYLPESEGLAHARALDARGAIENLTASFRRTGAGAPPEYELSARLRDVGFDPVGRVPGLTGLSGQVHATHEEGRWRIAENQIEFRLPRLFREPLAARVEEGEIGWRREGQGWRIDSGQLHLENEDGRAVARFSALAPGDGGSPVLDLTGQGADMNVAAAGKYIPVGLLTARAEEWFQQAFVAGRALTAKLIYQGPTRSFPFRGGEGEFMARAQVENAVLSYHQDWEVVSDATAEVEFRNQSMRIAASSARIAGLSVGFARAEIPDLKTTELTVRGAAHGDLGAALEFLRDSPVGTALGEQFARLRGSGPLRADVRLDLPIKRMVERDIEVSAQVQDASARLVGLAAPVHELNGALTVRNTLVAAGRLEGRWLGGPLSISVEPDGRDASILRVQGRTDGGRLAALMSGRAEGQPAGAAFGESGAASPFVQGEADWRASTRLVATDGGASRRRVVHIESDTRGLEVLLPAPLGKEAAEPRNLQVALEFDDHLLARSSFGEVRALIRMQRTPSGALRFDRGGVRADGVAPSLPDHPRLRIEGALDRLALDEWLALRTDGSGGRPLSEYLQAANVRVAQFELFGYRFEDVRGVLQATSGGWRVDVASPGAQGQIIVPENLRSGQPLRATLDRLTLRKAPGRENAQPVASDPRRLPALEVYVADLRMGSRNIGAVDLKASRAPQGLHFDSVTIIGDAVRAEARGRWLATSDGPQSWLAARVSSEDVGAALSALDYTPFMEAERGDIRADLTWPGGFDEDLLARASGAISLRVQSGQLVNVQPGAGRMLGLFSVAALPRRLALDFSDLTDKGLTFDSVHGDFELRNGAAYTNNLLLTGPAAEIGIAGRTGLATRDYDQTAVVTGALGASLPVAGALAGGPAVGAALLLFSQVFKEPLKGITRGYYRITGPWEDPTVERIDASAAAGQGAQAPES